MMCIWSVSQLVGIRDRKRLLQTVFCVFVFVPEADVFAVILLQLAVPYIYCSCLYDTGTQTGTNSLLIESCVLNRCCFPCDSDCKLNQKDNRVDALSMVWCK